MAERTIFNILSCFLAIQSRLYKYIILYDFLYGWQKRDVNRQSYNWKGRKRQRNLWATVKSEYEESRVTAERK